ncbi:MAG: hypothetical protein AB4062_14835 [Crocosphaera sp.]
MQNTDEMQWRIDTFFDYWKQRYDFIKCLDNSNHRQYYHESNVLLWSHLDALSCIWRNSIGKQKYQLKSKQLDINFDAFLACYYPQVFRKVSLPDLWIGF